MAEKDNLFPDAIVVSMNALRQFKICPVCGRELGKPILIFDKPLVWRVLTCKGHFTVKASEPIE